MEITTKDTDKSQLQIDDILATITPQTFSMILVKDYQPTPDMIEMIGKRS